MLARWFEHRFDLPVAVVRLSAAQTMPEVANAQKEVRSTALPLTLGRITLPLAAVNTGALPNAPKPPGAMLSTARGAPGAIGQWRMILPRRRPAKGLRHSYRCSPVVHIDGCHLRRRCGPWGLPKMARWGQKPACQRTMKRNFGSIMPLLRARRCRRLWPARPAPCEAYLKWAHGPHSTAAPYQPTVPDKGRRYRWSGIERRCLCQHSFGARTVSIPDYFDLFHCTDRIARPFRVSYLDANRVANC